MKKSLSLLLTVLLLLSGCIVASAECAHQYDGTYYPPTCNEQGYMEYVCKLCGDRICDGFVAATGHIYGEWELVTEATCSKTGLEKHVCRVCGGVETKTLSVIDHVDEDMDNVCDHCDFIFEEKEEQNGLSPYEWLKLFFANLIAWFKAIFA